MLSALRESGYSVTVVSNTTHEEVSAWSSCELTDLIEDPVFSFEVGAMKTRDLCVGSPAGGVRRLGSGVAGGAGRGVLSPVGTPRGPEFA